MRNNKPIHSLPCGRELLGNEVKNRGVLSEQQKEILDMLTKEYETPKRIALRRRTSIQSVYKTINKLKEKGCLTRGFNRGLKNIKTTQTFQPPKSLKGRYIRLHGQEWNIKILYKSNFFKKLPKNKVIFLDGNTIRTYEDSIEIYSNELLKFEAEDEWRATALSFNYWQRIFTKIENKLKITIIKEGYNNINLVNYHYAEVNNEIAKDYNEKKVKLNIYATEDGKLWFKIDHSWNLNELETLHPLTAKPDITKVKSVFNDIRDNPSYLPSYVKDNLDSVNKLLYNASENLKQVGHLITGNTTLIQRIETGFQSLQSQIASQQQQIISIADKMFKIKPKKSSRQDIQRGLEKWL